VQIWPFLAEPPLVMVDWLPWNHTFGGNFNFNAVLVNGGTLYVDAGSFVDPERPERGLVFGGRVTEDFKLDTGTWVNAGPLRLHVLDAVSPVLQDAVVCGHDRGYVAVLAWPNEAAAKEVATDLRAGDDIDAICASADLAAFIRDGLCRYNRHHPGSSTRVRRVMLMREPPSIDANEITDKGYINQRAALERRADLVKQLYRDPPPAGIIEIGD
ncbi:MAG TPA: hypothetical protein VE631_04590, partial [Alphaproteobacteria bacterium]|nr:hypothetical protein [Alphaproteobacteria bacterium]